MTDGAWMPKTDMANALVVGAQSGYIKETKTWILGRLLKDSDHLAKKELKRRLVGSDSPPNRIQWNALRISVFEVIDHATHGVPSKDWVWFSGYAVILIQLAISIVPWILHSQWGVFMITLCGNFLALIAGSLPRWKAEKWACPKGGGGTVTLTQGNGSSHAMVILGKKGVGLDLEILAQGNDLRWATPLTKISTAALAVFWIALLVTVSGLKIDTWCKSSN